MAKTSMARTSMAALVDGNTLAVVEEIDGSGGARMATCWRMAVRHGTKEGL
ncbi:hypothetical protein NKJ90_32715 [Mesorhizobium sp. M0051]|uniref:hypothetical protein n=1 Tax=Mesorhizobium sp. M0051 TaxID=2956862 RepID=UPI00333927E8